jgi:hypothetical protein
MDDDPPLELLHLLFDLDSYGSCLSCRRAHLQQQTTAANQRSIPHRQDMDRQPSTNTVQTTPDQGQTQEETVATSAVPRRRKADPLLERKLKILEDILKVTDHILAGIFPGVTIPETTRNN